jgi:hypothetical protein
MADPNFNSPILNNNAHNQNDQQHRASSDLPHPAQLRNTFEIPNPNLTVRIPLNIKLPSRYLTIPLRPRPRMLQTPLPPLLWFIFDRLPIQINYLLTNPPKTRQYLQNTASPPKTSPRQSTALTQALKPLTIHLLRLLFSWSERNQLQVLSSP